MTLRGLRRRPRPIDVDGGYALWAARYDEEAGRPLPRIEMAAIASLLPPLCGRSAGDLACGTGRHAAALLAGGARQVVAIDRSLAMLRVLAARRLGVAIVSGDLAALPLASGSLDLAVCGLAYGHLRDLAPAMAEAARVLRPAGTLVLSDFHADGAAAGLERTFSAGGRVRVLPHHVHDLEAYRRALSDAGLEIDAWREASARGAPDAFGPGRLSSGQEDLKLVLALRAVRR